MSSRLILARARRPGSKPPMSEPLLSVRGLRAGYRDLQVLRGVDFDVAEGSVVAVLGANGVGKTTLNKALSGLLKLEAGTIAFAGRRVDGAPPAEIITAGLIHVPEGRKLYPDMSVRENLDLGAYKRGRAERARTREQVLNVFPRLRERLTQRAGTLSGGEQQMVAIGRGLMSQPRLLILDEPSLGLAPRLVDEMFDLIRRLNRDGADDPARRAKRRAIAGGRRRRACDGAWRLHAIGTRRGAREGQRARQSLSGDVTMPPNETSHVSLKQRLRQPEIVLAAGVYDGLTASLASAAGFEALYVSGASLAYTRLGRPDIGLIDAERGRRCREPDPRPRRDAANRRRRHRLRQRAQRAAHCSAVRARRRQRDPVGGSDLPETLRPSQRQDGDPGGRDGGEDPSRRGCPGKRGDAHHRAHRRGRR